MNILNRNIFSISFVLIACISHAKVHKSNQPKALKSVRAPASLTSVIDNIGLYDFDDSDTEWSEIRSKSEKKEIYEEIEEIEFQNDYCAVGKWGTDLIDNLEQTKHNKFICSLSGDDSFWRIFSNKKNPLIFKITPSRYAGLVSDDTRLSSYILAMSGDKKSVVYMKKKQCSAKKPSSCKTEFEWERRED